MLVPAGDNTTIQLDIKSPHHGSTLQVPLGSSGVDIAMAVGFIVDGDASEFANRHAQSTMCMRVGTQHLGCTGLSLVPELVLRKVPVGEHTLYAWVEDSAGQRVGYLSDASATFRVTQVSMFAACAGQPLLTLCFIQKTSCTPGLSIVHPVNSSKVGSSIDILVKAVAPELQNYQVCYCLDNQVSQPFFCTPLVHSDNASAAVAQQCADMASCSAEYTSKASIGNLSPGLHTLHAWSPASEHLGVPLCNSTTTFIVEQPLVPSSQLDSLSIVTAVNEVHLPACFDNLSLPSCILYPALRATFGKSGGVHSFLGT